MVKGHLTLYSQEWRDFLDDSTYINVATFHFIRQEEDCYYVTVYNDAGHECNGYNLTLVGYRQRRCLLLVEEPQQSSVIPCNFLTNTVVDEFQVLVSNAPAGGVTHREVKIVNENRHVHEFGGPGWNALVHDLNLNAGTRVVFTNLLNNTVSLMPFDESGLEMRSEVVPRQELNWRKPLKRSPIDDDERMKHMCERDGCDEHDNERDCFYAPILAYVRERGRLNIPHGFTKKHSMWDYHNALLQYHDGLEFYVDVDLEYHSDRPENKNHVTIKTNWKHIELMCMWNENKMVRFKKVGLVRDDRESLSGSDPVLIPVFLMC